MTLTTSKLTRAAGVSAALSGLLYITVQFIHPAETVASIVTPAWAVVAWMTVAFGVLGLIGITGVYLRQVTQSGLLGLIGFLIFGTFLLTAAAFSFVEALVLPAIVKDAPQVVEDILGIFSGAPADGSLGALEALSTFAFGAYLTGGLVFGLSIFRTRVVSGWAGILLAAGSVSTLLVPLLPHTVGRFVAVPVGLALIWLGYSLWADRRGPVTVSPPGSAARLDRAAAE
ncbi:hypothetical protein ACFFGH_33490 [Lysobacter korlensis]|uniref:DUF4386 family protein n=1 Tax=Lysobacter korlensis TaxID=553636 RepID=A0ABV6S0L9_9GAMM